MANVFIDLAMTNANLRMVTTDGGLQYLPAAGGALEVHSGTPADYQVAATDTKQLTATAVRARFVIPTPTALPATLYHTFVDIVTHALYGQGVSHLNDDGVEYTEHDLSVADIYVDTTTTPWARVLVKRGSGRPAFVTSPGAGVELTRQPLYKAAGTNVTAETHIVGQAVSA